MTRKTASRLCIVLGTLLAASVLLGVPTVLRYVSAPYPANIVVSVGWLLCAGASVGLLLRKPAGFWLLYAATAWWLVFGAQIPYVPFVLTFLPARLHVGALAFVNVSVTLLAFCAHVSLRRG